MPSMEMNLSVMASVSRARCTAQWCTADAGPSLLLWVPVLHSGTSRRSAPGTRGWRSSRSFRKRDHAREARQDLVEQHADDADQQDRDDDIGDREIIPLVPDEVADAGAADQHLGGDDDEPGDADRDPHPREDGGRR